MPNTSTAKKRLRQSLTRRTRNRAIKSSLKTYIRRVRDSVEAGDLAKAETEFRLTAKKLDQAAAKGVIHANAASRNKSRLQHLIKTTKKPA
jgi:small subunit ribosomal protein S20